MSLQLDLSIAFQASNTPSLNSMRSWIERAIKLQNKHLAAKELAEISIRVVDNTEIFHKA